MAVLILIHKDCIKNSHKSRSNTLAGTYRLRVTWWSSGVWMCDARGVWDLQTRSASVSRRDSIHCSRQKRRVSGRCLFYCWTWRKSARWNLSDDWPCQRAMQASASGPLTSKCACQSTYNIVLNRLFYLWDEG